MKHGTILYACVASALCAVALISCGGGDVGGAVFGGFPQTPAVDLSGAWAVEETVNGNCQGKTYPENYFIVATITQSGYSISFFDPTENYTYQGAISGHTVSWTASRPNESGGTTSINFSGNASDDGNTLTGSATWTWSNADGSYTCNGTTAVSATRL